MVAEEDRKKFKMLSNVAILANMRQKIIKKITITLSATTINDCSGLINEMMQTEGG